jgi:hypothetical protein
VIDDTRASRGSLVIALLALALAGFASCRAREGTTDGHIDAATWSVAVARLDRLPALPAPWPGLPFWIGGWVGPPARALDVPTWRTFREAGFDISIGPLEDRYRRADNQAILAALDPLDSVFTFVRDDSLHPDETTRPGWEDRVRAIVAAYRGSRSLAGYFVADEPRSSARAGWAPAARLLGQLDPDHPAFVNFVGVLPTEALDAAAQARWRADLTASLVEGDLPFFSVDAYPFPTAGGERAHFLVTLREAARVSHETSRPFAAVLQFTGHGELKAASEAEASYQAMEALAHGASGVVWFTYWTPNPDEEPWRWHDGAIAYDGTPTGRYPILQRLNRSVRSLAALRGDRPFLVSHLGSGLPAGLVPDSPSRVPLLDSLSGPSASVGFSGESPGGERRYVLVHRDRNAGGDYRLRFDSTVDSARVLGVSSGTPAAVVGVGPGPGLAFRLEPGGAAVLSAWRSSDGSNRRSSSRSDTR